MHEHRRTYLERLVVDRKADAAAHDDVDLLVAVRLAMAFDHRRSDRGGPAVDAERPHVEHPSNRYQHRRTAHRRIPLKLIEGDNRKATLAHDD